MIALSRQAFSGRSGSCSGWLACIQNRAEYRRVTLRASHYLCPGRLFAVTASHQQTGTGRHNAQKSRNPIKLRESCSLFFSASRCLGRFLHMRRFPFRPAHSLRLRDSSPRRHGKPSWCMSSVLLTSARTQHDLTEYYDSLIQLLKLRLSAIPFVAYLPQGFS